MSKKGFGKVVALGAVATGAAWVYKKYDMVKSMYDRVVMFKSDSIKYDVFEGEAIAGLFSALSIDLSDAEFKDEEVYLDIYAFSSAVEIIVPSYVEVIHEGDITAGAIEVNINEESDKSVKLYVNYKATTSAIEITDELEHACDCDECGDEAMEEDTVFSDEIDEVISAAEELHHVSEDVVDDLVEGAVEVNEEVVTSVSEGLDEVAETIDETIETIGEDIDELK